jgi:hypothetical protein
MLRFPLVLFITCLIATGINGFSQAVGQEEINKLKKQSAVRNAERAERIKNFAARKAMIPNKEGLLLVDITPSGLPVYKAPLNSGAATTTGASRLQNQFNGLDLQGENITVGVFDDGIVKTHVELGNRILTKEGLTEQSHATHVTGTILATGVNPLAKGMAPKALATTWYFEDDDEKMASLAKPDQTTLLFSNHSYGTVTGWTTINGAKVWSGDPKISNDEDYRFGFYSDIPQTLDQIAYLAPYYSILWAAGNDRAESGDGSHPTDGNGGAGYDCIIPESTAKNLITVGAVNKITSYTDASSVVLSNFSSAGPTDDGRIKPDFVAAGVNVFSLSAVGVDQYTTFSGTSMATPNATGSLVLIQELYNKLHGGNFMKAATLKALAIHTTKEAGSFSGPDYRFGWGLLDVEAAAKLLLQEDNVNTVIKELTLNSNATYTFAIQSKANEKITATICWTDPAGNPVSASLDPTNTMLVNDLDIRITDSVSTAIFPWILNPFNPANKATTGDNFRDNVEKIEFDNPAAKKYYVTVSHKGQLVNDKQDFSIIITCKSSLANSKTYYWIGNDGDWNDGTQWSLSSGGAAANTLPGSLDHIVFDENSFDGVAARTVSLSNNITCAKLTWLTSKASALSLNNHTLKVSGDLSLASKNFQVSTEGTLQFECSGSNNLSIHSGDISKAALLFSGGLWKILGDFNARKLEVTKDGVSMVNSNITLSELNAAANTSVDLSGSTIGGISNSSIDSSTEFISNASSIVISTDANFNWYGIIYNGSVTILNEKALVINGSNTIYEMKAFQGAMISVANASTQVISKLTLTGSETSPVKIQSIGTALINLTEHEKLCFDFLNIQNVNVAGNAVVSVGLNSSVLNAPNWLQQDCETTLFADFETNYICSNALTLFTDNSAGSITSWSWDFGDVNSPENVTSTQHASHTFNATGDYTVTLTVSNGITTNSYSEQIAIKSNDLALNSIVVNGNSLLSFHQASGYQWYRDGVEIDGATSRSFNFDSDAGIYNVVISNGGDCNVMSSSYIITGLEEDANAVQLFPNPVQNGNVTLTKKDDRPAKVILSNNLGQVVMLSDFKHQEMALDLKHLPAGLYHLEIKSIKTYRKKIIINR